MTFDWSPTPPDPSLCDTCQHAYKVAGGSVGANLGDGYRSYDQRYCHKLTLAIHMGGKQECESHQPRVVQS